MCAKKLRLVLPVISHYSLPVDTGRKLNVHKTFRRRPGRLLNFLCTFNIRPVANEIVAVSQTRVISKLHICTLQVESTVIDRFRTEYSFESLI